MRRILYTSSIASGHRCVLCFFFNDLKNSPFFFGQKKGVLSLLHQKDTQIPMRVTRIKQLRTRNKETTNAKSLQQIFILTRKYMLHSILRSLFESLVRVSLPSSPRARASRLPFFSKNSSDELGSRRLEKNRWI
jgi:hypothetical protein